MNTFLDYLTVLAVAALLLAPALYGALRERRTDRELAAAARRRPAATPRPAPAPRPAGARPAAWRRGRVAH
ncbi:hypothetical protein ACQKM2_16680 [Streptomyces sp. NPDC004126]|uniref:hypothetical protein n=1 Tax=Streptomyces sp. NPDC004126 TaxID=3390695 RepID=UPI003CFF3E33